MDRRSLRRILLARRALPIDQIALNDLGRVAQTRR
jgi:hypothetical protein